jgi:hypothetical protein
MTPGEAEEGPPLGTGIFDSGPKSAKTGPKSDNNRPKPGQNQPNTSQRRSKTVPKNKIFESGRTSPS